MPPFVRGARNQTGMGLAMPRSGDTSAIKRRKSASRDAAFRRYLHEHSRQHKTEPCAFGRAGARTGHRHGRRCRLRGQQPAAAKPDRCHTSRPQRSTGPSRTSRSPRGFRSAGSVRPIWCTGRARSFRGTRRFRSIGDHQRPASPQRPEVTVIQHALQDTTPRFNLLKRGVCAFDRFAHRSQQRVFAQFCSRTPAFLI